jgi:S1-C subfamily serine protease
MQFIKKDYKKAQRRKWWFGFAGVLVFIALVAIWSSYSKKSDAEKDQATAADRNPELTGSAEGKEKKAPAKKRTKKDLPTLVKKVKGGIGVIHTYDRKDNKVGQGTGFFINKHGHAVSNYHVFRGAYRAEVKLASGAYKVKHVLAEDAANDLILFLVDIKPGRCKPLSVVAKAPQVGEKIVVIGNPLGLEATVSDGIVSARRELEPFGNVIQITSPISPGSSGSPVFNMYGEVIGVATFQFREGQNLNFAVPIEKVKKLVPTGETALADLSFADPGELAAAGDEFSRGLVYYNAGEFNKAADEFKKAVEKDPTSAEKYYYLGMSYKEVRPYEAVDAFKNAIGINSQYLAAYSNLGMTYVKLELYKKAAQVLREALEIDPDYPEALMHLGIAYALDKEFRAAVKMLEKAVEIDMDPRAYYYLGLAYLAIRTNDKALYAFQSAVDLDNDFFEAYIGLGYCYAAVKNWKRGIDTLRRAQAMEPGHPEIYFLMGFMYLGSDDVSSAERQAKRLGEVISKWRGKKVAFYDDTKVSELLNQLNQAISQYKRYRKSRY